MNLSINKNGNDEEKIYYGIVMLQIRSNVGRILSYFWDNIRPLWMYNNIRPTLGKRQHFVKQSQRNVGTILGQCYSNNIPPMSAQYQPYKRACYAVSLVLQL